MNTAQPQQQQAKKNYEGLANIAFNIIIPVLILTKLSKKMGPDGPTIALIIALVFPIGYGLYDYIKNKQKNVISALGIVNILFTGGLALLKLEGIWFAVKEAAFPALIGIIVLATAFSKKPAIQLLAYNKNLMNTDLVDAKLIENNSQSFFKKHLKNSTLLLSLSFFLSAILNYALAIYVFKDIDPMLSATERSSILNDQIAKMTWQSFIVIALPLTVFMGFILFHLVKGIRQATGLQTEDIFPALKG